MRLTGRTTIFSLCLSLSLVSSITARMQLARQPHIASSSVHKRTEPHYIDARNVTLREDPAEMVKRDGTKYVFMHHVRGLCLLLEIVGSTFCCVTRSLAVRFYLEP